MTGAAPVDVEALGAALAAAEARAANAETKVSDAEAQIAALKLMIEKLRREFYGRRSERKARLLDQLEMQLDELTATAAEDELAAEQAAAGSASVSRGPLRRVTGGLACCRRNNGLTGRPAHDRHDDAPGLDDRGDQELSDRLPHEARGSLLPQRVSPKIGWPHGVMTSRAPTVSHRAAAASAITGNRGRSIAGHVSIEDSWRSSSAS